MSAQGLARWEWVDGKDDTGSLRLSEAPIAVAGQPRQSVQDATTLAAREILDEEAEKRAKLTASLRAARLAREAKGGKK